MKAALGYAYALASNRNAAREIIDELAALDRESSYVSYHIATVYAGLGEKDKLLLRWSGLTRNGTSLWECG